MRSFHATYSRTPVASHLALTGPRASLAFGSFSHDGWFRRNVCCEGGQLWHHQLARNNGGRDCIKRARFRSPCLLSLHKRRDPRAWYDQAALFVPTQRNEVW